MPRPLRNTACHVLPFRPRDADGTTQPTASLTTTDIALDRLDAALRRYANQHPIAIDLLIQVLTTHVERVIAYSDELRRHREM